MKDLTEMSTSELNQHMLLALARAKDPDATDDTRATAQAAYDAARVEVADRLDNPTRRPTRRRPMTATELEEMFS